MNTVKELYVAFIISIPDDPNFRDAENDEYGLDACNEVATKLIEFLKRKGHTDTWSCDEDWGVYSMSSYQEEHFQYIIGLYDFAENGDYQLIVQYYYKVPFFKSLFKKRYDIPHDHQLHDTMKEFSSTFKTSKLLTESEFKSAY